MIARTFALALVAVLVALAPIGNRTTLAQNSDMTTADSMFADGDFAGAQRIYERVLTSIPGDATALYNAGQSAYLQGNPTGALRHWGELEKISGNQDLRLKEKIIQALQALDRNEDADARVEQLELLRRNTIDEQYRSRASFCRDQFSVSGKPHMAHQHFEFPSRTDIAYTIYRLGSDGKPESVYRLRARAPEQSAGDRGSTDSSAIEGPEYVMQEQLGDGTVRNFSQTQVRLTYDQFKRELIAMVQEQERRAARR